MTETERKALALVNEVAFIKRDDLRHCHRDHFRDALLRAIEQHEAFRQEVSDAVEAYVGTDNYLGKFNDTFGRFIIAKPDPLVEVLWEAGFAHNKDTAANLRAAIEKRGGKIVWGEG